MTDQLQGPVPIGAVFDDDTDWQAKVDELLQELEDSDRIHGELWPAVVNGVARIMESDGRFAARCAVAFLRGVAADPETHLLKRAPECRSCRDSGWLCTSGEGHPGAWRLCDCQSEDIEIREEAKAADTAEHMPRRRQPEQGALELLQGGREESPV